ARQNADRRAGHRAGGRLSPSAWLGLGSPPAGPYEATCGHHKGLGTRRARSGRRVPRCWRALESQATFSEEEGDVLEDDEESPPDDEDESDLDELEPSPEDPLEDEDPAELLPELRLSVR